MMDMVHVEPGTLVAHVTLTVVAFISSSVESNGDVFLRNSWAFSKKLIDGGEPAVNPLGGDSGKKGGALQNIANPSA